ncbi:hypothetical protein SAMN05421805_11789 [Saccharopolyspora antimicrobica]|uniref:Uncharacterized protein n=1 Tax=Saccharopolyspora antimicrobica TaxID=455193 RepID=A0A1I5I439_9PSEU|nr:hypothetical protein ATL45_1323 [Saccharopolyspora antimicrobica]SFO55297.1 hypothetical protein SAMN05421805_11789 [Saccharopolyspora antimicrobica]
MRLRRMRQLLVLSLETSRSLKGSNWDRHGGLSLPEKAG